MCFVYPTSVSDHLSALQYANLNFSDILRPNFIVIRSNDKYNLKVGVYNVPNPQHLSLRSYIVKKDTL